MNRCLLNAAQREKRTMQEGAAAWDAPPRSGWQKTMDQEKSSARQQSMCPNTATDMEIVI